MPGTLERPKNFQTWSVWSAKGRIVQWVELTQGGPFSDTDSDNASPTATLSRRQILHAEPA